MTPLIVLVYKDRMKGEGGWLHKTLSGFADFDQRGVEGCAAADVRETLAGQRVDVCAA
jgi:hypothetical protein